MNLPSHTARVLAGAVVLILAGWLVSRNWSDGGPPVDSAPGGDQQGTVVGTESGPQTESDLRPDSVTPIAERREAVTSVDPDPRARIHGIIVDDRTDLPVEGITVTIGKGATELESISDAEGRFAFDAEPAKVSFGARLANGTKLTLKKRRRVVTATDLPVELRVRIGPLYLIEIVGPKAAQEAEWKAHLIRRVKLATGPARERDLVPSQRLDDGDPRKVRFSKHPSVAAGDVAFLALRDASGEWRGEVKAPHFESGYSEVIQIPVSQSGVLVGRVVEEGGEAFDRVSVHLTPAGSRTWPPISGPWTMTRADKTGAFRFEGLPPQDFFVRIAPPWRPMVQMRVSVAPGQLDLGTIEIPGGGELGEVSGVIKSAAGRGGICAILQLESLDGTGWAASTIAGSPGPLFSLFYGSRPAQAPTEDNEVAFSIASVPAGHYRLVVVPWDGRSYESTVIELDAPTNDVVVLREDSVEDVGMVFEVTDAETGERIETYMARFHTARWGKEKSFPYRSGEVVGRVAPVGDLLWAVFTDGHAPVYGDASAFAGTGDPRVCQVTLRPGWGADFTVRDGKDPRRHHNRAVSKLSIPAPGEARLSGVAVFADGERVGTTDESGRVRVELDAAPERIEFRLAGWETTTTTTFADGKVLEGCPSPKVWMVRSED